MILMRGGRELQFLERAPKGREGLGLGVARGALITTFALMIGLSSSCGAARPSKYYQLTVPADADPIERADAVPVTLLMGQLITSHLYREDRIVYGNGPERLGAYEYHRWAEPPAEMIQEVLLRLLRATGHYRAVHVRRSNVTGDFMIHGRLYDFKEVEGSAMSARV